MKIAVLLLGASFPQRTRDSHVPGRASPGRLSAPGCASWIIDCPVVEICATLFLPPSEEIVRYVVPVRRKVVAERLRASDSLRICEPVDETAPVPTFQAILAEQLVEVLEQLFLDALNHWLHAIFGRFSGSSEKRRLSSDDGTVPSLQSVSRCHLSHEIFKEMDRNLVSVRYMVDGVDAAMGFYTTHLGVRPRSNAAPAFADITPTILGVEWALY